MGAPGEQFTLTSAKDQRSSFSVVPKGKKFILTDVMYQSQRTVRQNIVVNIAKANPTQKTHDILFQVSLDTGKSEQVHLCSGYEIPAGYTLSAFTGAGYAAEQYISISVTGYLVDEQ
jgi:hypothetical protein